MMKAIQIALTGLQAASRKAEASASNIANLSSKGALKATDGPAPYQALTTTESSITGQNGEVLGISSALMPRGASFVQSYEPDSPFANAEGLIGVPDIDLAEEMVNLQIATNTYKANLKTIEIASEMNAELLRSFDHKT